MHWGSYIATLLAASSLIASAGCGSQTAVEGPSPPVASAAAASAASTPTSTAQAVTTNLTPAAAPQTNHFKEAVNRATSAVALGQSAQSPDDWKLAASRWQQALGLMQKVPTGDPNHATAQTKIKEYQQHLAAAQQRASGVSQPAASSAPVQAPNGLVAQIPVIERRGGTPVVPVTFTGPRGEQQFSMLFDTGATGTLITSAMAEALGVVIVGETIVTIADGSQVTLPIAYVDVIEVGGLRKEGVVVAIGGDVGLLGQDIYGDYGISMGGSTINLYE